MKKKVLFFVGLFSILTTLSLSAQSINLKTGKYLCRMVNLKMKLVSIGAAITGENTSGQVFIEEGYRSVAMGNYTISGKKLVVEFYFATGPVEHLQNQTRLFIIEDSETFYAPDNEDEQWFFVSAY